MFLSLICYYKCPLLTKCYEFIKGLLTEVILRIALLNHLSPEIIDRVLIQLGIENMHCFFATNPFIELLNFIQNNEQDAPVILQNKICKKILLEKRPKNLPHWILSLAEKHPKVVTNFLQDEEYKNSLSPIEFLYLVRNYPDLEEFVRGNNIAEPMQNNILDEDDFDGMDGSLIY